jgi:hypothetical protein
MGSGQALAWSSDDEDPMSVCQQGLPVGINEASIGGHQSDKASDQVVQQLDVMRAGGQERTGGDHPTTGDAQAQLKAIVVQLLGGTVAIIGQGLEAAVAATAGVATHRQGQRINDLTGSVACPLTWVSRC